MTVLRLILWYILPSPSTVPREYGSGYYTIIDNKKGGLARWDGVTTRKQKICLGDRDEYGVKRKLQKSRTRIEVGEKVEYAEGEDQERTRKL